MSPKTPAAEQRTKLASLVPRGSALSPLAYGESSTALAKHWYLGDQHGNSNQTLSVGRLPKWLKEDYLQAIRDLAEVGTAEVLKAKNSEDIRAILIILAIAADARTHGKFLINYSAEELLEMERLASEVDP